MKILIAPLNWGLGHATRCIPLIRQYMANGDEVVLGGDGDSLLLLHRTFPELRIINLPSLELCYDKDFKQRKFYWRSIPILLRSAIADHYYLRQFLAIELFDLVISDNRFGFFSRDVRCVYITHQLYPILPKRLFLFQPLVRWLHARVYNRYDEVWVPDYEDTKYNLSGALSHGGHFDERAKYIGPLSRFSLCTAEEGQTRFNHTYSIVAILSGLEPQRTIFEQQILNRFSMSNDSLLLVRGKVSEPQTTIQKSNITIVPNLSDLEMMIAITNAQKIIARSGYSTIMDLEVLGVLSKAELHPTPGQSEQEYLAQRLVRV
ncbi:MAG: glycosyltransferase [Paludibacteraceae bacterium]|nr:glycosyltransferase [Paludibacteraceae bacterium]